ncbi:MAG: UTP--glucose-1-phosphate uridylyltransferase GalU [Synergistales bacterium]|jgi:UTP--glucose-1-phosphate uridylyltransferase|nr:UTP--glucose-1-phosphate uridylyltransferase GalU [Synergistales bacterium]
MVPSSVRSCLFPVAGLGTRFLPATKEVPKEMIPLIDRPLIHYGVEEAAGAGCREMVFVTSREKRSIEDYFDRSFDLERALRKRGKDKLCQTIAEISELASFSYVRQREPLGLGHAVLCGEPLCSQGYFGVILPDDVMIGDPPVLSQLVSVHEKMGGSVIALEEVEADETSRYGIVRATYSGEGLWRVTDLVEKPLPQEAPSRLAIMGRYVLSPRLFDLLRDLPRGRGGEIQLTDGLRRLLEEEPIWGVTYKGRRYDCGTRESWLRATVSLALEDPSLREIVLDVVRKEAMTELTEC